VTLERLALSRSTLDRAAHRRSDAELTSRALADPLAAVLPLVGGWAPVVEEPGGAVRLCHLPGGKLEPAGPEDTLVLFLGEDDTQRPHLAVVWPGPPSSYATTPPELPAAVAALPLPEGARWAGLREVGTILDDADAGVLTSAVALATWHVTHPRCARCGEATAVVQAGWSRRCPACGAEHFPRTDPAVIMAVEDADGRILLGRQATWPERRYSVLAGFVEPGESLEAAVRREVAEESGVVVGGDVRDVTYRGSQPWPFPSSLMVAFRARATTTAISADGDELAHAGWWERDVLAEEVAGGALMLPPRVSIARRLIEDWYGGPIDDAADWR
jgi:NAD+ diphosphatase